MILIVTPTRNYTRIVKVGNTIRAVTIKFVQSGPVFTGYYVNDLSYDKAEVFYTGEDYNKVHDWMNWFINEFNVANFSDTWMLGPNWHG